MKNIKKILLSLALIFTVTCAFANDKYDIADADTLKARIAKLHPDFANNLKRVLEVAGQKEGAAELGARLQLDVSDYVEKQTGFAEEFRGSAAECLQGDFVRALLEEHQAAIKELEEGGVFIEDAIITLPSDDTLKERLGDLASLGPLDNVMKLTKMGRSHDVMQLVAALFMDFYALGKKLESNIFTKRCAVAIFMLRDKMLTDMVDGDVAAIAKMKKYGAFKDAS